MSEIDVHKEVQNTWNQLQQCQHNASDLRAQWLESIVRYKASVKGDADIAKAPKTMIKNLNKKQMHHKLSYITKGSHSGLDYTEVHTAKWYYLPKSDILSIISTGLSSLTQPALNPKSTFICTIH